MSDSEDLQAKHRKEKKDLQAKIQQMKKNCDKKKKKEVLEEIVKLEADLERKQNEELENEKNSKGIENLIIENEEEKPTDSSQPRISKAQKRRDKKAVEEKERQAEIEAQQKLNVNAPRQLETVAIKKILKDRKLDIFQIPSDGDCLYNAIKHQMLITREFEVDLAKLREMTADFIKANKDNLIFYMTNASGDCLNDKEFNNYCELVRNTRAWGGQVEIQALSSCLKVPIEVLQASGPPTIQGAEFKGPNLIITYHRHMYSLGEHYNSTKPANSANNEEEEES